MSISVSAPDDDDSSSFSSSKLLVAFLGATAFVGAIKLCSILNEMQCCYVKCTSQSILAHGAKPPSTFLWHFR